MRNRQVTCVTAVALLIVLAACSTVPPATQAYQTVMTIAGTVDVAMKSAGYLYQNGQINDVQKEAVLQAYSRYQKVAKLAVTLIRATQNITKSQLDQIVADVAKAAKEVVDLVKEFQK